jgi:membrane associated rhomboid family serine protease
MAFFLDVLVVAAIADLAGLVATWILWRYLPAGRPAVAWIWRLLGAAAVLGFLLRDTRGGLGRRWLALEARRPDGRPPGALGSVARNLPLLIPFWNLYDAWPVFRRGEAPRRADRRSGIRIWRIS